MAYIIENNLRLKNVNLIKQQGNRCLVSYADGSGFWTSKKKVYNTLTEAYQELRKRRPDLSPDVILSSTEFKHTENNAVLNGL